MCVNGTGKPEALKRYLSGLWSRRITGGHRSVYRAPGRQGEDQRIEVIQCRYHACGGTPTPVSRAGGRSREPCNPPPG
ncbi:type II toxin-antitoxin system YoeB family toxin [Lichenicola sp.]|uniref:type II toxin-antitoxin system YoeB family toxin n=1 Tax=Lichenicola sp. TaxID=2804529 RepID=UPI003B0074E8